MIHHIVDARCVVSHKGMEEKTLGSSLSQRSRSSSLRCRCLFVVSNGDHMRASLEQPGQPPRRAAALSSSTAPSRANQREANGRTGGGETDRVFSCHWANRAVVRRSVITPRPPEESQSADCPQELAAGSALAARPSPLGGQSRLTLEWQRGEFTV